MSARLLILAVIGGLLACSAETPAEDATSAAAGDSTEPAEVAPPPDSPPPADPGPAPPLDAPDAVDDADSAAQPVDPPPPAPVPELWAPAVLHGLVVVASADGLRVLDVFDAASAQAALDDPPPVVWALGEVPTDPLTVPDPASVDSAEIVVATNTAAEGKAGCVVRGWTPALAVVWSSEHDGVCLKPGATTDEIVVPVFPAAGKTGRLTRLHARTGEVLGEVVLPHLPVTPAARIGTGGSHWVVAGASALMWVDVSAGQVVDEADLTATPTSVAVAGGGWLVVTARAPDDPEEGLGRRILRFRIDAEEEKLVAEGPEIVTPGAMHALPVAASPCAEATGGSHWWCDDGLIATGGSHWLAGWRLTNGAERFLVAAEDGAPLTTTSLSLGDDGRIYTGGSHWLDGVGSWGISALSQPPEGGVPTLLPVLEKMAIGPTRVPSMVFSCSHRTVVMALVATPDGPAREIHLTDTLTAAPPPGTWARSSGDAANAMNVEAWALCGLLLAEATCGNGEVEPGELCDDGNEETELPDDEVWRCGADCRMEWSLAGAIKEPLFQVDGVSYRVRYLSDGLEVLGWMCLPKAGGEGLPLALTTLPSTAVVTPGVVGINCKLMLAAGTIGVVAQPRGTTDGILTSGGQVELCQGEVRDLFRLTEYARALPQADPERIVSYAVGDGACAVGRLVHEGPKWGAATAFPALRAAVLATLASDSEALWQHHTDTLAAPEGVAEWALDKSKEVQELLEVGTGGTPAEVPEAYDVRSVVTLAPEIVASGTAVMLLHGDGEHSVPFGQSCLLHGAMKDAGAEFVYFTQSKLHQPGWPWPSGYDGCEGLAPAGWFPGAENPFDLTDYYFVAFEGTGGGSFEGLLGLKLAGAIIGFLKSRL